MKKFTSVAVMILMVLLTYSVSFAGETYSKFMAGVNLGDLSACYDKFGCADEDSDPKLDTDTGYMFQVVPIAFKTKVTKSIEMALEPTFFITRSEYELEYQGEGYKSDNLYNLNGDTTDYGFMGNVLVRYSSNIVGIVPYAGAGIGVKYSSVDLDQSCEYVGSSSNTKGCRYEKKNFNGQRDPHNDFVRVWNLIAGLEVPLMGDLRGNLQYQYMHSDRARDTYSGRGTGQGNWNLDDAHIFSVGLTF